MDFSIGDLSRRTGVKVPTIRYYEKEGLIEEPIRTEGNQRRYTERDLERLTFIRHGRDLGLPMMAIRELLDLSSHPDAPCADADRIASEQLQNIRTRIAQLQRLEAELLRITQSCTGTHAIADCNVLKAFGDHRLCKGEH
ncbi:transcriptional regulator, MerR family [Roseibium sp. TrichSKD4]|uniref:MerR family transcriptional regulator n=1 Tax=Roseibium sp. TrichSKD4 TaxID=744980 RepID=UPI0001E56702|nr:helix-turn-helix domain-containing protein [Roseibium sp. TrichSKD4]EFO32821.1 transcriptional regulator, MerR family [Roseibium sp. TrichSKD4]